MRMNPASSMAIMILYKGIYAFAASHVRPGQDTTDTFRSRVVYDFFRLPKLFTKQIQAYVYVLNHFLSLPVSSLSISLSLPYVFLYGSHSRSAYSGSLSDQFYLSPVFL